MAHKNKINWLVTLNVSQWAVLNAFNSIINLRVGTTLSQFHLWHKGKQASIEMITTS